MVFMSWEDSHLPLLLTIYGRKKEVTEPKTDICAERNPNKPFNQDIKTNIKSKPGKKSRDPSDLVTIRS